MEHDQKDGKLDLWVASDCLAVPEIHTGLVTVSDDLECEACPVFYDGVAIPEVRFQACGICRPKKRPGTQQPQSE